MAVDHHEPAMRLPQQKPKLLPQTPDGAQLAPAGIPPARRSPKEILRSLARQIRELAKEAVSLILARLGP